MKPFDNLAQMFLEVTGRGVPELLLAKRGGVWEKISAHEFRRRVARLVFQLERLGVQRGDRVALIAENSPEWAITDFACIFHGAVLVPIYATLPAAQCAYVLNNSEARALFLSTPEQVAKLETMRRELRYLHSRVLFQGAPTGDVIPLGDLIGPEPLTAEEDRQLEEMAVRLQPGDLFSILYTSGTTGTPKGVMLTHRNICSNVQASERLLAPGDLALSFLPLSHVYERMADYTYLYHGAAVAYLANIEDVAQAMLEVRPTVMAAVPRFFEKLYGRVMEGVRTASPWRQKLFWWAVETGKRRLECDLQKVPVPLGLALRLKIAERLVFSKLKARLGGRLHTVVSGSAPLAPELIRFFLACGLTILEGYGLTETSPVLTANLPGSNRPGTVGRPIAGVQIKIAEDGEILARGPNIMTGYYKMPEETNRVLRDGWFHTGDIGHLDADGYLVITDRKKDLLKTAGGKFVAPQPIESKLKTNPYILNVVVFGDRRRFVSALVVVNMPKLSEYAAANGIAFTSLAGLLRHPRIGEFMQKQIDDWTPELAQFERIKKVVLLDQDFTMSDGTLTPTMKLRRTMIEKQYAGEIAALYQE